MFKFVQVYFNGEDNYGTRTHDGFVFAKYRMPETDHDIIEIIKI